MASSSTGKNMSISSSHRTPMRFPVVAKEKYYRLIVTKDAPTSTREGVLNEEERNEFLNKHCELSDTPFKENVCTELFMPWHEQLIVVLIWALLFGLMLSTPLIIVYMLFVSKQVLILASVVAAVLLSSVILPIGKFRPNLAKCTYIGNLMLKYFSHRGIWKDNIPSGKPSIIVAPPHGVFPFGSLLACISVPRCTGLHIRGLAANALLRFPILGDRLRALGMISADKQSAKKALAEGWCLGISSGGIAEIFESYRGGGGSEQGTETIILKSRHGICKLALETGAYLCPSYVFGNSLALTVIQDNAGLLARLSRYIRVAICFFYGRWGLPIPRRVPMLGVLGSPIIVEKTEHPTAEQIQDLLLQLEEAIEELFETHKAAYGWQNVRLVIK